MSKWKLVLPFLFLMCFSVALIGCGAFQAKQPSCLAGTNEQCPTPEFVRDYEQVKTLRAELSTKELRDKVDLLNGATTRLQNSIPRGYTYDEEKKKFILAPVPTPAAVSAPTPTPAPVPAPAAPAKK